MVFHYDYTILHSHQSNFSVFSLTSFTFSKTFITATLESIKCTVALSSISQMTTELNIFSCAYWSFVYLLWSNIYSNTSHTLN